MCGECNHAIREGNLKKPRDDFPVPIASKMTTVPTACFLNISTCICKYQFRDGEVILCSFALPTVLNEIFILK